MDLTDHRTAIGQAGVPPLEALAREALASCHADLLAARQTVLSSCDPVGIHGTRVALRRLRAAATLFGRALGDELMLALRPDAKQLADACGTTRDLDVFLVGVLAEAQATFAARPDIVDKLRSFRAAALRLRRTRHDAARRVLTSEILAGFDARLTALLKAPAYSAAPPALQSAVALGHATPDEALVPAIPDAVDFARDILRRRDRKLRKGLGRLDKLDGAGRHRLRLQVKKQRYATSFLATLFDRKAAEAYIRAAAGLQDALGLANDRVVAAKVVADVRAAARPKGRLDWVSGAMAGWLAVRAQMSDKDDRAVAAAAKRFIRARRFWRRRGNGDGK